MKLKSFLLSGLFCVGLVASTASIASAKVGAFQAIEQPLPLKLGVTVVGLGLVVTELWWFLLKRQ
ncbi:MAG: hypothetical protein AAGA46_09130 [Cyanobacteria bacterium P01_F01_bin.13]